MRGRLFIIGFLGIIITPALTQLAADIASGRAPLAVSLADGFALDARRFAAFEKRLEEEWWATPPTRAAIQSMLLTGFREGNDKVLVAHSGWLVYRPGMAAVVGPGPFGQDVKSVAKPPPAIPWLSPFEAIVDFAAQLKSRKIELVFVPVPDKVTIHPAILVPDSAQTPSTPLRHPDMPGFERQLRNAGVTVLPLATMMREVSSISPDAEPLYLKTDTHWSRAGLDHAVGFVAAHLVDAADRTALPLPGLLERRSGLGDLVKMLAGQRGVFGEEFAGLWPSIPAQKQKASDVLVLGDSFVNIYRDPALGFGRDGGFAELLGERLGGRVDVIAINGGAATQVRRELARNPALLDGKRFVVWVVAERELCPASPTSRTESAVWQRVKLPPASALAEMAPATANAAASDAPTSEVKSLVIEGTIELTSAYPPPGEAPYRDCLGVMIYKIEKINSGHFADATIPVVHWIFRDEKLLPPSNFSRGQRHTLTLTPFSEQPSEIQNIQRVDDSGDVRPLWWVERWE